MGVLCFMCFMIGGYLPQDPPLPLESSAFTAAFAGLPEAATLSHSLIGGLALTGCLALVARRKVLTLPAPRVTITVLLFGLVTVASVFLSKYRMISLAAAMEWASYLAVFFLSVSVLGRKEGPKTVLAAISIGGLMMALRGVLEFMTNVDPNWRIFAGWIHPNVAAAALTLGALASLTLIPTSLRWFGTGSALIQASAVFLTGSKGGTLGLLVGFVMCVLLALISKSSNDGKGKGVFVLLVIVSILGGLFLGTRFQAFQASNLNQVASNRLAQGGQSAEQSSGFRSLLWKTSVDLMKKYPVGTGVGTFKYHSAETGRTTQTQMAHSSPLQIGVETGWLGLGLALALILLWFVELGKGLRSNLPEPLLRAAVMGAVTAVMAHSIVDSNLQHFGIGFLLFVLLAIGINLSVDGTTPEFSRPQLRFTALAVSGLTLLGLVITAWNETSLSKATDQQRKNPSEATQSLSPFYALDHRAGILAALTAPSGDAALSALKSASESGPTLRGYRLMAQVYIAKGDNNAAISSLEQALTLDPNNLPTLSLLLQTQAKVDLDYARATAERMVQIEEKSTYFNVRAIPELVPLETVSARLFLAQNGGVPKEVLPPAAIILQRFLDTTVQRGLPALAAGYPLPGMAEADLMEGVNLANECVRLMDSAGLDSSMLSATAKKAAEDIATALEESRKSSK